MTETQCKQCGGTIHPYECGSGGCCGECNYHAALTSSASMTERAAIVAWLRGKYWPAAEAIERGAHLDGEE